MRGGQSKIISSSGMTIDSIFLHVTLVKGNKIPMVEYNLDNISTQSRAKKLYRVFH